ncbi:MAG: DUF2254 domain-containing protein [Actinobacteria bacterium]|nr:DUF2254 domain-containing protein [Actinomycetota bacterium]
MPASTSRSGFRLPSFATSAEWRREALRMNLWFVPALEIAIAVAIFAIAYAVDRHLYDAQSALPGWLVSGSADAARQIITALAAAVITVIGVVFSIILVTLTLASTQFGPRMLRNFIRDRVTQVTLGTFVATFVYAVLVLAAIGPGSHGDFVPHIAITILLVLVLADLGVLVYFIHHISLSIQLPHVIASIARDLSQAIDAESSEDRVAIVQVEEAGPSVEELLERIETSAGTVPAPSSGYLQFVRHSDLVEIATRTGSVIQLVHRPGNFVVAGQPLARVWPAGAAPVVADELARSHFTGPVRTITQDIAFAVDQLVEIAIRALSPAVNDTFTALTCIDWLTDGLCQVELHWDPVRIHRDAFGYVRVVTSHISHRRLVQRAYEKIRQAGTGMPAVMIRQLDGLTRVVALTSADERRAVLREQGEMIMRSAEESVSESGDLEDVRRAYGRLICA